MHRVKTKGLLIVVGLIQCKNRQLSVEAAMICSHKLSRIILAVCLSVNSVKAYSSEELGYFRNTYYYLTFEEDYVDAVKDQPVKDIMGNALAWVTTAYKKSLNLEGSGKLRDGRILNFADRIEGEIRYRVTPSAWGNGIKSCELVPFRTLAVDGNHIPHGSLVFLPATRGMKLPDGSTHDGYWRADDRGSAIQKDRIDIFVGKRNWASYLDKAGVSHLKPIEIFMVELPQPDSCVFREIEN